MGKTDKPTRIRRSAEESRDRILKQAIRLLSRHGLEGASFQAIADACDISQSAVLYHFPTKEKLIVGVIEKIVLHNHELVLGTQRPEAGAMERLEYHFQANLDWATKFPEEAGIVLLLYYLASFRPDFAKLYQPLQRNARERIRDLLLAGQRERLVRSDLNVDESAETLHDSLLGGIVNAITVPGPVDRKSVHAKWEALFEALL